MLLHKIRNDSTHCSNTYFRNIHQDVKKKPIRTNTPETGWFSGWMLFVLPLFFLQTKMLVDVTLVPKYFYACMCLVLAGFLLLKKPVPDVLFRNPLVRVFALFTLWTFAGCFYSSNASDGCFMACVNLLFFLLTTACVQGLQAFSHRREQLLISLACVNLITLLLAAREFLGFAFSSSGSHAATYVITGTFGHKNILSEMILFTAPSHLLLLQKKGVWRNIGMAGLFFSAAGITLLLTRSVWLAAALSGTATAFVFLFSQKKEIGKRRKIFLQLLAFFSAALFTGALVYGFTESFTTLYKQLKSIAGTGYGSGGERVVLWQKTLSLFKEHPIHGAGTGSWKTEVLKYGYKGLETENNLTFHQRPHNDFLWVLSENGLIGFLLYISIWLLAALALFRAYRKNSDITFLIGLCVLISFAVISCFGFPYERMEHKAVLVPVLAFAVLCSEGTEKKLRLSFVWITGGLVLMYAGLMRGKGEYHLHKAYVMRAAGDWEGVISETKKAENPLLRIDPMCTPLHWYSGSAWYNSGQSDSAFADFRISYRLNPNHVHVLNNLATCYEVKGRHSEAIMFYKKALKLSPGFSEARFNLVAAEFNSGDAATALKTFTEIPPDTADANYKAILHAVLRKNLLLLAEAAGNTPLNEKIMAIHNVNRWHRDVYLKSLSNHIPFQRQVLLDAGYLLTDEEKMRSFEVMQHLLKKFPRKNQ